MSAAEKLATVPDLTRTLDHEALWPDPEDCPDWPLYPNDLSRQMNMPRTRADAEKRLHSFALQLNGGNPVHAPTTEERKSAHARWFMEGQAPNWRWPQLGLARLAPVNRSEENKADMIVECAHIRGWLRKLDEREQRSSRAKEDAEKAALRAKVDGFPAEIADLERKLAEAEEGERRYQQHLADKNAAIRAVDLRRAIRDTKYQAGVAASKLGVTLPGEE